MKKILVNDLLDYNIYLIGISEEENGFVKEIARDYKAGKKRFAEFLNRFNIDLNNVLAYGETSDVSHKLLDNIIPQTRYPLAPRPKMNSYHCYATNSPSIVMHEDLKSSWKCLMTMVNNPEYVLIYKEERKDK